MARLSPVYDATNFFEDGDELHDDGYIWRDGQRVRPWSVPVPEFPFRRVWKHKMLPTAENVRALEALRWRVREHMNGRVAERWRDIVAALQEHGKCDLSVPGEDRMAVFVEAHGSGIRYMDAEYEERDIPGGTDLGNRLRRDLSWCDQWGLRITFVNSCLEHLLDDYCLEWLTPPSEMCLSTGFMKKQPFTFVPSV